MLEDPRGSLSRDRDMQGALEVPSHPGPTVGNRTQPDHAFWGTVKTSSASSGRAGSFGTKSCSLLGQLSLPGQPKMI